MKAMLAWRLDLRMKRLADPPRAPAALFRAPPGYRDEAPAPSVPDGFEELARAGAWSLLVACAGGRELTPATGRTGS